MVDLIDLLVYSILVFCACLASFSTFFRPPFNYLGQSMRGSGPEVKTANDPAKLQCAVIPVVSIIDL